MNGLRCGNVPIFKTNDKIDLPNPGTLATLDEDLTLQLPDLVVGGRFGFGRVAA